MHYTQLTGSFFLLPCILTASACVTPNPTPAAFTDFNDNIFFFPAANAVEWKTLYARSLQLADESLLMTWENYPAEPPLVSHPIYRSVDGGATYSNFSSIRDQVNGWGMRFQPFLYTLPQAFGGYPAGTLLAAGVSAPQSLVGGVYIDLYVSKDSAKTWNFVSHIAYGDGPETITSGNAALWEPFLMMYDGQLVCYFSDQRDPAHSQKLSHVTTNNLLTWSAPVVDVAYPAYNDRPGMTTVAYIASTEEYIMTYEYCGSANCAVHYKTASNPLNFNAATGIALVGNDTARTVPYGSPYVIWTPNPASTNGSGVIIVSSGSLEPVLINGDSADPSGWKVIDVGQWSAYSRSLRIITVQGKEKLLFGNGGNMGNPDCNSVANGVIEVPY